MQFHPLSEEIVEVTANLSAEFVEELDMLLNRSGKMTPEKARSQFIEDILYEWYNQEWRQWTEKKVS